MFEFAECFETVTTENIAARLQGAEEDQESLYAVSSALEQKAWYGVSVQHLQYSAGMGADELRGFYPMALEWWEEYGKFHEAYQRIAKQAHLVAHMPLAEDWYWNAVRMTSFAILLGHAAELRRLCYLWDYSGQMLDGLLERLVIPSVPGRPAPPDECRNHLPYFKLLKVFDAAPADRPPLMSRYMDDWYEASRREPYYRSHTKGREHSFLGYWSFEAAAVTQVLGIDDSSYRDHEFYPKDLADFARSLSADRPNGGASGAAAQRLRCDGGQPCPREGYWFTPARANSRRHFKEGEPMPDFKSDYGATIWQWDEQQ